MFAHQSLDDMLHHITIFVLEPIKINLKFLTSLLDAFDLYILLTGNKLFNFHEDLSDMVLCPQIKWSQ
jgi:hypothetical protein